jgi:NitT/TauT family transport system permease protein
MTHQAGGSSVRSGALPSPRRAIGRGGRQPDWSGRARRLAASVGWWVTGVSIPLLAWELIAALGWVNPLIWPPPHLWLLEAWYQPRLLSLDLWAPRYGAHFVALSAIFATLKRVVAGVLLALVAALVVGGLAYSCKLFGKLTLPVIAALASIAPIGWLPVALVVVGIGDGAAIFVVFISSFCVLTTAAVQAMRNVDPVYINAARVLGADRSQLLRYVILPGILPTLFTTVRVVVFMGWIAVLSAEILGVSTGLAAIIAAGRGMMNHALMYLGIAMVCAVGVLLDRSLDLVQRRLLWWKGIARA